MAIPEAISSESEEAKSIIDNTAAYVVASTVGMALLVASTTTGKNARDVAAPTNKLSRPTATGRDIDKWMYHCCDITSCVHTVIQAVNDVIANTFHSFMLAKYREYNADAKAPPNDSIIVARLSSQFFNPECSSNPGITATVVGIDLNTNTNTISGHSGGDPQNVAVNNFFTRWMVPATADKNELELDVILCCVGPPSKPTPQLTGKMAHKGPAIAKHKIVVHKNSLASYPNSSKSIL